MKRPVGFTILSLILFWLTIGALANFFMSYKTLDIKALIVAYGLTACAAAIGLWRFEDWAYKAFLSWSVVVLLLNFDLKFGAAGMFDLPMVAFIPYTGIVVFLLYLLVRYIRSQLNRKVVVR